MPNGRKPPSRELFGTLSGGQGRLLVLCTLVLLALAYMGGALVQSSRDARSYSGREQRYTSLNGDLQTRNKEEDDRISEFSAQNTELAERLAALASSAAGARTDNDILARENDFLTHYIAYGSAQGDGTRQALVDCLCPLWKDGSRLRVKFAERPLEVSQSDISLGRVSPDMQTLLVQNFVSLEPLQRIRQGDAPTPQASALAKPQLRQFASASVTVEQALAALQRQAARVMVLSTVTFPDGSHYEIAKPVAVALQIRRECAPH